jgi:hypothetical protein
MWSSLFYAGVIFFTLLGIILIIYATHLFKKDMGLPPQEDVGLWPALYCMGLCCIVFVEWTCFEYGKGYLDKPGNILEDRGIYEVIPPGREVSGSFPTIVLRDGELWAINLTAPPPPSFRWIERNEFVSETKMEPFPPTAVGEEGAH